MRGKKIFRNTLFSPDIQHSIAQQVNWSIGFVGGTYIIIFADYGLCLLAVGCIQYAVAAQVVGMVHLLLD